MRYTHLNLSHIKKELKLPKCTLKYFQYLKEKKLRYFNSGLKIRFGTIFCTKLIDCHKSKDFLNNGKIKKTTFSSGLRIVFFNSIEMNYKRLWSVNRQLEWYNVNRPGTFNHTDYWSTFTIDLLWKTIF